MCSPCAARRWKVQLAAGDTDGSIFGFTYAYNDLDDVRKPTNGATFSFSPAVLPASAAI